MGDIVVIKTAGGGGYGSPWARSRSMIGEDIKNGFLTSAKARLEYSRGADS